MTIDKLDPFLKWAGGKSQLLKKLHTAMPGNYNKYYEPFIGGGAMLFNEQPQDAVISDINGQLINIYQQIKTAPDTVIEAVNRLDSVTCDKDLYYKTRAQYNQKILAGQLDAECAALMIWINKHCFNGLYRVNTQGLFNVPYNNKNSVKSINAENIYKISTYLNTAHIKILCQDFSATCENVQAGDFVYFDSPYIPVSETANFTDYTKDSFSYEDHLRLANLFKKLSGRGAKIMLSNHDVPLIYELYKDFNITKVDVRRLINCDARKRMGHEVIVTNYSLT